MPLKYYVNKDLMQKIVYISINPFFSMKCNKIPKWNCWLWWFQQRYRWGYVRTCVRPPSRLSMQKMLPTRRSLQTGRGQPTASGLQKWRRPKTADKGFQQLDWGCCHLRKGSPRGSPCCHFGKIKFIKYIAMLFLTFGVDLFLPLGWGCSIYDTNIMYHCGIYSPLTRNC